MKARIAALSLLLMVWCAQGSSQRVALSITIGTHVLTLGMPESTVLEQLGTDLELRHLGAGKVSSWMVERKVGSVYKIVGNVVFDSHGLTSAIRYWETDESSGKSLFYAVNEATQSLKHDGLTNCNLSTSSTSRTEDSPSGSGSGSTDTKEVVLDCGAKRIKITLNLSDVPGFVPTQISVTEWLKGK
jgi:hypothetical protein